MKSIGRLRRRIRAAIRFARDVSGAVVAKRERRDGVAAGTTVLFRNPSRRAVAELSNLLAVAPIVFGLSVLAASPWPQRLMAPVPRESADGAPARMPAPDAGTFPEPARQIAKNFNRVPANEIGSSANLLLVPELLSTGDGLQREPRRIDRESARVVIAEDGQLIVDGEKVRLAGIAMPDADAACTRLDGVEVRCLERVVARLTILAQQHGAVTCRTTVDASGEQFATCAAGKIDLAQDLVQARLARRVRTATRGVGI